MIATALMLLLATPQVDPVVKPREDYAKCLRALVKPALESKLSNADFAARMKEKCAAQESAFRAAAVASAKADHMSDKDAQEDAQSQIDDYMGKFGGIYGDFLANGGTPGD